MPWFWWRPSWRGSWGASWAASSTAESDNHPAENFYKQHDKPLLLRSEGIDHTDFIIQDLESPFSRPAPIEAENSLTPTEERICEEILGLVRDGSGFQKLVDAYPEDVLTVLKHHAVLKLGSFQATDSQVLAAFGSHDMLTRGCDVLEDPDWKRNWQKRIESGADGTKSHISVGWEEMVSLTAYAVNIRNVAARDDGALLKMLLQKYSSGAASKKIWEFPAVQAVINYHWQHWASHFLFAQSIAFLGWLLSFSIYLCIYISEGEAATSAFASHVLNLLCFGFMIPFALIEGWTLVKQKDRWLQPRNVLDVFTIIVQLIIFVCHILDSQLDQDWFSSMLGFQCVFLFLKLQNFGRVLGTGASISEIFASVMYDARFLIGYIFLTGISASLCLGAIYKHEPNDETKQPFRTIRNSVVSTFHIMFGGFDPNYIFESEHQWVKFLFFFGLQVLMSITVLNLLIAVMTESYSKFAREQRIRYNRGRASVIDELEILKIPDLFTTKLHSYIHYLVIEKKSRNPDAKRAGSYPASRRQSLTFRSESKEDLRKRVDDISAKLDTLLQLVLENPGPRETEA